nr:sulfatase [Haloferax gibbonsii]
MSNPNIVCISIDSARADFSALHDPGASPMPFLSSLASEATVFEQAISPSVFTLPVHTSVFTGLFPLEHGIFWEGNALGDHPTFAELLADNGYETTAFYNNSWLDTGNILRGFETKNNQNTHKSSDKSKLAEFGEKLQSVSNSAFSLAENAYSFQDALRRWIRHSNPNYVDQGGAETLQNVKSHPDTGDDPFCWFIHFNDAHFSGGYSAPHPYHKSYTDRSLIGLAYNQSVWNRRIYGSRLAKREVIAGNIQPPHREVETFKNLYLGCLEYCDELVKGVVDELKARGEWDDTILVVFGDHGDSFGERGVFGHHCSVDDSLIRVPLLIRDPDDRLHESNTYGPVSLIDIYSTILEMVGISHPETKSQDLTRGSHERAFVHYHDKGTETLPDTELARLSDDLPPQRMYAAWESSESKIIWYPDEDEYEIQGPRGDQLKDILHDHMEGLSEIEPANQGIDRDTRSRLQDMGYL